jgi:hypothetical protein
MLTDANPDRDAVRHILTTPAIAHRTASHLLDTDFDFDGLRREAATMSGGEALLVRIAYELWNAEKVTGLWELPRRLDDSCFPARARGTHDLPRARLRRTAARRARRVGGVAAGVEGGPPALRSSLSWPATSAASSSSPASDAPRTRRSGLT